MDNIKLDSLALGITIGMVSMYIFGMIYII